MNAILKTILVGVFVIVGCIFLLNSSQSAPQTILPDNVVNQASVAFPESMPGDTIIIKKVIKNGVLAFESNSALIQSVDDLVKFERKEFDAKRQKYGVLSEKLSKKLPLIGDNDSVKVKIDLKIQPQTPPLDKTKYSMEVIKAQKPDYLKRIPLVDKISLKNRYKILEATLLNKVMDAEYKNSPDMLVAVVNKSTLHDLCFDNDICSVEEYEEPVPCQSCANCYKDTSLQSHPPCLSTLATSAYNPASAMPSNAKGQGVNAATFEIGLRPAFVSCINLGSNLKYYDAGYNGKKDIYHSEQCFRCLTNAAPQANFYHRNSLDFSDTPSEAFIINNGIQTVSLSYTASTNPTNREMRHVDAWAYKTPYPVFCNPTGNGGYCQVANWGCYNAINVGNVQHFQQTHYIQIDSATHCTGGCEQAANPTPLYGSALVNPFSCSSCDPGARSDRELPMVVAPGISPLFQTNVQASIMSDPCFLNDSGTHSLCGSAGTSYSAPICNGIAACVISADSRMVNWPEKVRAVILATAQNVDFNYWNYQQDGRDGAGTICGSDADSFARNHTEVQSNYPAAPYGMCAAMLNTSSQGQWINFNISIPSKPTGKHLRVVLTWDSSPSLTSARNDLSDLDLSVYGDHNAYGSGRIPVLWPFYLKKMLTGHFFCSILPIAII